MPVILKPDQTFVPMGIIGILLGGIVGFVVIVGAAAISYGRLTQEVSSISDQHVLLLAKSDVLEKNQEVELLEVQKIKDAVSLIALQKQISLKGIFP